jgi:hypothetical protein
MQRLVPAEVGLAMILAPATLRAGEQALVDSRSGSRVFQFFALRRRRERGVRAIGASNFAGKGIDLAATYELNKNSRLRSGYRFFAGDYLYHTGVHSDADFAYLMTTFTY